MQSILSSPCARWSIGTSVPKGERVGVVGPVCARVAWRCRPVEERSACVPRSEDRPLQCRRTTDRWISSSPTHSKRFLRPDCGSQRKVATPSDAIGPVGASRQLVRPVPWHPGNGSRPRPSPHNDMPVAVRVWLKWRPRTAADIDVDARHMPAFWNFSGSSAAPAHLGIIGRLPLRRA